MPCAWRASVSAAPAIPTTSRATVIIVIRIIASPGLVIVTSLLGPARWHWLALPHNPVRGPCQAIRGRAEFRGKQCEVPGRRRRDRGESDTLPPNPPGRNESRATAAIDSVGAFARPYLFRTNLMLLSCTGSHPQQTEPEPPLHRSTGSRRDLGLRTQDAV